MGGGGEYFDGILSAYEKVIYLCFVSIPVISQFLIMNMILYVLQILPPFYFAVEMVDIWNIIECFRENGLNTLEADTELNSSRVEAILNSIFTQLNKRIPTTKQVDISQSVSMLLNWLLSAYDRYEDAS